MERDVRQEFLDSLEHAGAVFCSLPRWQRKALHEIGNDTYFYAFPRHLTREEIVGRLIQKVNDGKMVDFSGNEFVNNGFYKEVCDNYGIYQLDMSFEGVKAISIDRDNFGKSFPVVIPSLPENYPEILKELDKSHPYRCSSPNNILDFPTGSVCAFFLDRVNDYSEMIKLKEKNSAR